MKMEKMSEDEIERYKVESCMQRRNKGKQR